MLASNPNTYFYRRAAEAAASKVTWTSFKGPRGGKWLRNSATGAVKHDDGAGDTQPPKITEQASSRIVYQYRRISERVKQKVSWQPYRGKRGGTGWQSSLTGKVAYQDEMPGDDEHGGTAPASSATATPGRASTKQKPDSTPAGTFAPADAFEKPAATRINLRDAKRVGTGKAMKIVLDDGTEAPPHIQSIAGKIPPAWENVQVSLDPKSDVLATGTMTNRKTGKTDAKTVYNTETWEVKVEAIKFARVREGLRVKPIMEQEIRAARDNPETRDAADLSMLLMSQATRPGSDADTKGMAKLYGKKMTAKNVKIAAAGTVETVSRKQKDGSYKDVEVTLKKPRVELVVGGETIPIRDEGAAAEIMRRVEEGGDLQDSTYWLKSFGATTLEARHVVVDGKDVRLEFMGKETVWHRHVVTDPSVAKMLVERKKAAKSGDAKLFESSETQLNKFISDLDGGHFTAKDFRTMKATQIGISEMEKRQHPTTADEYEVATLEVAKVVSRKLGNQAAQALASYIDPTIFHGWRKSAGVV